MYTRRILLGIIVISAVASQAFCMSADPVSLRLNWKPGETYKYMCDIQNATRVGNESAQLRMRFNITFHVLKTNIRESTMTRDDRRQVKDNDQLFALGGRLLEVKLQYGDVNMILNVLGKEIDTTIGKENAHVSVDGNRIPSYELGNIQKDFKPFQDILKADIMLLMTDSGRVVRVSGLEKLDSASQKEMAMSFLEGMMLPEKPMKVGDKFVDKRSLESLLPRQPGKGDDFLGGRTFEIVRTLQSVQRENNGRMVARFSAPTKERFKDVIIYEDGTKGSFEMDILYTTVFDAEHGTILRETSKGTILLRTKEAAKPGLVTVQVNATIALVEPSTSKLAASDL